MKKKLKKGELVKKIQKKLSDEYRDIESKMKRTKVYKIILDEFEKSIYRTFDVNGYYFTNKKSASQFAKYHKIIGYTIRKKIIML